MIPSTVRIVRYRSLQWTWSVGNIGKRDNARWYILGQLHMEEQEKECRIKIVHC
jgi:hypothetical protein